jgi:Wall-associated receptor kinase galacturonan-binding
MKQKTLLNIPITLKVHFDYIVNTKLVNASFNMSFPIMHRITILSLLLLLIYTISTTKIATAWSDYEEFFEKCPPANCSGDGPEVRFPFRLSNSSTSCGAMGMELSCLGNETILQLPNVGPCKVLDIGYKFGYITVELGEAFSLCAYQKLGSINFTSAEYQVYQPPWPYGSMNLINCPRSLVNESSAPSIYSDGPVDCLSNSSQLAYFLDGGEILDDIPSFCTVLQNNITFPFYFERSNHSVYVSLTWSVPGITKKCLTCERENKHCAGTKSFCHSK